MVEVDRSSEEAIFDAVMYEPETRLFTDRAWAILQKELPKARVLAVNVSHLAKEGQVRDAVGEEAGRNLRSLLGGVFQRLGGEKVQASQPYGDQLTAAHDDDACLQDLAGGISEVAAKIGVFVRREDGAAVIHKGLDFKYATGATYGEADRGTGQAGDRGTTRVCADGELGAGLAQARVEGYLMLDGDLLARQGTRDRYIPWAPSRRWIPRGPAWPSDLDAILEDAAGRRAYFAVARELVWAASRAAIAGRLSERVARNESSSVLAGSFSSYVDGVQTLSCVSHATLYDDYEGTRSMAELSCEEQDALIQSVFDKEGDCRALAVASDVKKAQVEGLWTLVVLLGCSLETAGRIGNFEKRELADNLRIVRSLAGTNLHQRLASAHGIGAQEAKAVEYDWSELESPAIQRLMQSRAGDPLPLVQREILQVLRRAPLPAAPPPLPVVVPPPLPAGSTPAARAATPTAVVGSGGNKVGFFGRLFGSGRGQPGSDRPPEARAEPPVARKATAEARVTPPAGVPPGVNPEFFARMKAYADEVAAADPVEVARTSLSDIKEIQERDLDRAPDLRVDDARYVATYVCWKPSMFDEAEVTAIYREVRECARDIALRWRRAGGRIVPDNRMFELLEANMTEAERAEHQSATAEDCELVHRGMLAAAQLALLPADALETRDEVDEDED